MDLFQELMQEKNKIVSKSLLGEKLDFTRLREIAVDFAESNDVDLKTDGTDEELWKSVTGYLRKLLKGNVFDVSGSRNVDNGDKIKR